jgi:hypothetical protein
MGKKSVLTLFLYYIAPSMLTIGLFMSVSIHKNIVERNNNRYDLKSQLDKINAKNIHPKNSALPKHRNLTSEEIAALEANGNVCENWGAIYVSEFFMPQLIKNCHLSGTIYLGSLARGYLNAENLSLEIGIYNSRLSDCYIGNHPAIYDVKYLSRYIIQKECILFNIGELHTTDNPQFGHSALGENEEERIEFVNENGNRKTHKFSGMRPADVWLCYHSIGDGEIMNRLDLFTNALLKAEKSAIGVIDANSIIKNCETIIDVCIGKHAIISSNKSLTNLTIESSEDEPTTIINNVELCNGIIGYQNLISAGVVAAKFATGRNVKLLKGARIENTFVSDNSSIACCEVLNSFLYPFHEQHHNNSFLIAAAIMGQSNIAAGAVIGSNHNSRGADGEIIAGRGFWPALATDFKHNSIFSSFTIIANGSYQNELHIKFPFSLVSVDPVSNDIQIMPGYWFKYNMYALERNAWKFKKRDKRIHREQAIEAHFLAPDTAVEMMTALKILVEELNTHLNAKFTLFEIISKPELDAQCRLFLDNIAYKKKVRIIKPAQAIALYYEILHYYGASQLIETLMEQNPVSLPGLIENARSCGFENLNHPPVSMQPLIENLRHYQSYDFSVWYNAGGQLITKKQYESLREDILKGKINSWFTIHEKLNQFQKEYINLRRMQAILLLLRLEDKKPEDLKNAYIKATIKQYSRQMIQLEKLTFESRQKDFQNPFRKMVYQTDNEMEKILVKPENDPFLQELKQSNSQRLEAANDLLKRIE